MCIGSAPACGLPPMRSAHMMVFVTAAPVGTVTSTRGPRHESFADASPVAVQLPHPAFSVLESFEARPTVNPRVAPGPAFPFTVNWMPLYFDASSVQPPTGDATQFHHTPKNV